MVQDFQVLRCFSCQTFQVHQVKKSKKWACKLCGEKQSLLKVYGQGCAGDCRHHVQKLNLLRGEVEEAAHSTAELSWQDEVSEKDSSDCLGSAGHSQPQTGASMSRWNKYLQEEESENLGVNQEEEGDGMIYTNREQFYNQRKTTSAAARKRKPLPEYDFGDQGANRGVLNMSKKNRSCEEWAAPTREVCPLSCTRAENVTARGCVGRMMLPVGEESVCFGSGWEPYMTTKEQVEEDLSSTHSSQKNVPNMDTVVHHKNKISLTLWTADGHSVLPSSLVSKEDECPGQDHKGDFPFAHQPPHCVPNPSSQSSTLNIFQTEEDFDDDY
ncbi:MRN complex-interacting protein isoform X2 [Hyperolius riggenbachi]|uniref:MRN complex-interacting protein isoform X2 n=1 Tax=Hyperolius riggenbachi TaxID=752182 RepID=UPI0035A3054D